MRATSGAGTDYHSGEPLLTSSICEPSICESLVCYIFLWTIVYLFPLLLLVIVLSFPLSIYRWWLPLFIFNILLGYKLVIMKLWVSYDDLHEDRQYWYTPVVWDPIINRGDWDITNWLISATFVSLSQVGNWISNDTCLFVFEVRSGCLFCWCLLNCWPSLLELSYHRGYGYQGSSSCERYEICGQMSTSLVTRPLRPFIGVLNAEFC